MEGVGEQEEAMAVGVGGGGQASMSERSDESDERIGSRRLGFFVKAEHGRFSPSLVG